MSIFFFDTHVVRVWTQKTTQLLKQQLLKITHYNTSYNDIYDVNMLLQVIMPIIGTISAHLALMGSKSASEAIDTHTALCILYCINLCGPYIATYLFKNRERHNCEFCEFYISHNLLI